MNSVRKISFRQKNSIKCPICSNEFYREELFSGGGRLIAGALTDELRRQYEDNKKYGIIYPLAYTLTVCNRCLYSAFQKDFLEINDEEIQNIRNGSNSRVSAIEKYFGEIDFNQDRNLLLGAASYMLAVDCYSKRNKKIAPTFKSAISSIRAAWLFDDLGKLYPEKSYKKMSLFFYKKAYVLYLKVIENFQSGDEPIESVQNMGPDTDKNWGYEGVLYMSAVLTLKVGSKEQDMGIRLNNFNACKRYLSRIFGLGKSSKSKPSEILDKTRNLYDKINQLIEQWEKEVNIN